MTQKELRPAARLSGLERWLSEWSRDAGVTAGRLRRRVAVIAVAGMLDAVRDENGEHLFQVKGGTSLELRFGLEARTSKDLDAVYRGAIERASEEVASAVGAGWHGFTGIVGPVETIDVPGLRAKPVRFGIKLRYRSAPFFTLPMEVSEPEGDSALVPDIITVGALTEVRLPAPGPVPCLSLRYQVAQKLHACTDPLDGIRLNYRARDLADLILITDLAGSDLEMAEVRSACVEIFELRGRQSWPPALVVHEQWPGIWQRIVEEDLFPIDDVHEAGQRVRDLIGTIDAAT